MDGDGNGASGKDRDERDESGEKQDNLRVTKTGRVSFFYNEFKCVSRSEAVDI